MNAHRVGYSMSISLIWYLFSRLVHNLGHLRTVGTFSRFWNL